MRVKVTDVDVIGIPGGQVIIDAGSPLHWQPVKNAAEMVVMVLEGPRAGSHGWFCLPVEKAKELNAALSWAIQEQEVFNAGQA